MAERDVSPLLAGPELLDGEAPTGISDTLAAQVGGTGSRCSEARTGRSERHD
jgi:hypothetical protein